MRRFFALGSAPVEDETADIAIRTDHVRIGAMPADGLGFDGIVSNVEYLGAKVKLTVTTAFTDEFTAVLTDAAFLPPRFASGKESPCHGISRIRSSSDAS